MCTEEHDNQGAAVALVSGALIGVFATLLVIRARRKRATRRATYDSEYHYDGGDLFV